MIRPYVEGTVTLPGEVDLTPAMEKVAQLLLESVAMNFMAGGRPLAWQAKADGTPSTLYQSGALMRTMREEHDESSAFVYMGKGIPYAAIHQFGGWAGRNHASYIPERPYLLIQDKDVMDIMGLLDREIIAIFTAGEKVHIRSAA
jgi:phage virion morphogenesis protein